ncbi:MAG: serine hydrolase domain-containing protein [Bacteroidota bacterium]
MKTDHESAELAKYELEFTSPEEAGFNPDSLKKIDEMIMEYVDQKLFPGAVVLLAKEGKIIYETEVGWSDSLQTEPYRKDHIFRLASMTKPFTSVAALQLMEKGKLNLNEPISKYIPEFADPKVMVSFNKEDTTWESRLADREPTVANLLNQTAGVPYGFMNPPVFEAMLTKAGIPDLATHLDVTLEEKMAVLAGLPLIHDPGERWMYGLNTDVLGRVVEIASGQNLSEYVDEHISQPLGIKDMNFFLKEEQAPRLVDVYIAGKDNVIHYLPPQEPFYIPNYPAEGAKSYYSGGSGLNGTARDYFRFCQAVLDDGKFGEAQILKSETAQMMHASQIDTLTYPWGPFKFGYGFDIADGHSTRPDGTYSWGGAFSTMFWIDPENEIIGIMLSQVLFAPDGSMSDRFEEMVYNSLIDEKEVAIN